MAEQQGPSLELHWERLANGRFSISVGQIVVVQSPNGEQRQFLPFRVWLLTTEEETKLKAALSGIAIAIPTNGHRAEMR